MIVITGGLGFIGKNLVKELQNSNYQDKQICVVDKKNKNKKITYFNNIDF